ncbi:MAG: arginine repressor [Actinobacteria bacterium]|nr:arginine repressor [Actinomycetota bacterium]
MAKRQTLSANARRALVIALINQGRIHSQSDLVALLDDEGIDVTQATASRDLDEVGAVRVRDENGVMRYKLLDPASEQRTRMNRVSDELVLSMTSSGNMVVIKTPAGGAQLLASTLDRAASSGVLGNIIGTIAGDDTVLVVSKSPTGGKQLERQLSQFLRGKAAK